MYTRIIDEIEDLLLLPTFATETVITTVLCFSYIYLEFLKFVYLRLTIYWKKIELFRQIPHMGRPYAGTSNMSSKISNQLDSASNSYPINADLSRHNPLSDVAGTGPMTSVTMTSVHHSSPKLIISKLKPRRTARLGSSAIRLQINGGSCSGKLCALSDNMMAERRARSVNDHLKIVTTTGTLDDTRRHVNPHRRYNRRSSRSCKRQNNSINHNHLLYLDTTTTTPFISHPLQKQPITHENTTTQTTIMMSVETMSPVALPTGPIEPMNVNNAQESLPPPPAHFKPRCHPKEPEVTKEVDDYFVKNWPFPNEKAIQKFHDAGFSRVTCCYYPEALDDRIHFACRLLTLLFLIDGKSPSTHTPSFQSCHDYGSVELILSVSRFTRRHVL
jgi:hypothetical protein